MSKHDAGNTGHSHSDRGMSVSPDVLNEVIRRIIETAQPMTDGWGRN